MFAICNSNVAVSCPSSDPTEVSPDARPRGDDEIKKKDEAIMDEVIPLIEEVRNIWNEAYKLSVGQR